ncbi:MAG: thermonuclease family protein [Methanobrevibacter sp.]|jgi:hypothetical protein|nr:thermonuclease family protein [Candidatus Methanoflexus mossambicus]
MKTYNKYLIAIFLIFLISFLGINGVFAHSKEKTGKITRVIDGDTYVVSGIGKVRLVGVDTPEISSSKGRYIAKLVKKYLNKKYVSLDIDNKCRRDRYGRTLAVVYWKGININRYILNHNYGKVMYIPPSEFKKGAPGVIKVSTTSISTYKSSSKSSSKSNYVIIGSINSDVYHKSFCASAKRIKTSNKIKFKSISDAKCYGYRPCKKESW